MANGGDWPSPERELYEPLDDGTFAPPGFIPGPGYVMGTPRPGQTTLPPFTSPKLPPMRVNPIRQTLQSADLVHSICEHELAEAIAVVVGKVDVLRKDYPEGYNDVAREVLEYIGMVPPCPAKGAR